MTDFENYCIKENVLEDNMRISDAFLSILDIDNSNYFLVDFEHNLMIIAQKEPFVYNYLTISGNFNDANQIESLYICFNNDIKFNYTDEECIKLKNKLLTDFSNFNHAFKSFELINRSFSMNLDQVHEQTYSMKFSEIFNYNMAKDKDILFIESLAFKALFFANYNIKISDDDYLFLKSVNSDIVTLDELFNTKCVDFFKNIYEFKDGFLTEDAKNLICINHKI